MGNKKIFIVTVVLLLIVGTGSFVFAGGQNEELNVNNKVQDNNSTNTFKPIDNSSNQVNTSTNNQSSAESNETNYVPVEREEASSNTSQSNNTTKPNNNRTPSQSNTTTNKPNTSGSNGSNETNNQTTTAPQTPSVVNPPINSGENNQNQPTEEPEEEKSTLEIISITTSNNNGQKRTYKPIRVTIEANETITKVSEEEWQWLDDEHKIIYKDVTSSGKINVYDSKGLYIPVEYIIENYDPDMPEIITINNNDGSTTIIVNFDKEVIFNEDGWEKSEDEEMYSKTVSTNDDGTITITIDGEVKIIEYSTLKYEVNVDNYDSATQKSNPSNKVIVRIKSNGKKLMPIEDSSWYLEDDYTLAIEVYEEVKGDAGIVTITDVEGNEAVVQYTVSNVNSTKPKLNKVTIDSNGIVKFVANRTGITVLDSDWKTTQSISKANTYTKQYTQSTKESVIIQDKYSNTIELYLEVTIPANGEPSLVYSVE